MYHFDSDHSGNYSKSLVERKYIYTNHLTNLQASCSSTATITEAYEGECTSNCQENIILNKDTCFSLGEPTVQSTMCPDDQPEFGSACSLPEGTQCPYREECCCDKCHPR